MSNVIELPVIPRKLGELTGYQEGVKLSAIGSTVTVQECKMLAEQNGALIANARRVMEHNKTLRATIERLTKELSDLKSDQADVGRQAFLNWTFKSTANTKGLVTTLRAERDQARSEVETAKAVENTLSMEISSLQAEVERLKARLDIIPVATGAPRCKLCGVLLSGELEKQFCSTCCAR